MNVLPSVNSGKKEKTNPLIYNLNLMTSTHIFRASHDSEYRKLKSETKKLLEVVGNVKKTAANHSQRQLTDIAKLAEEIATLKDGNAV